MKTLFSRPLVILAPLLITLPLHARVDATIVPADSMWLIYADFNALRASTLGKQLVAIVEQSKVNAGQAEIGLDMQKVLTTVGSVTAYGTSFSQDPREVDGALIAQGTADLRKIAESLLLQANLAHPDDVVEVKDLPFPAYALRPHDRKTREPLELIVAFPPEPIVIASKSRAQLLKAREVFRHASPSVSTNASSPLKDLVTRSDDAYIFAAAVTPPDLKLGSEGPQTRVLKMTKSGALSLGEKGPYTYATAQLVAASDDMADKLMKILQGMTAMMSLAETNDKQLAEFLSSAKVSRDDNTVNLHLEYSSERLVQMVKTLNTKGGVNQSPEERLAAQGAQLVNGKPLAQWQADSSAKANDGAAELSWRTIEKVSLKSGSLISLGRFSNGGRNARIDRVEIIPADGGHPLVFRTEFMRAGGPRNNLSQFQFPGEDGTYTIKVAYVNDPAGKALYAVSVREAARPQSVESN